MMTRHETAAGTGKQDKKETASGTESRAESGTVCAMAQTTALKAGSPADSILELYFEESLAKIVSISILFCSRKARQPEGSAFLYTTGRLLLMTAASGIGFHFGAKPKSEALTVLSRSRKIRASLHPCPDSAFSNTKNRGDFIDSEPSRRNVFRHKKLQGKISGYIPRLPWSLADARRKSNVSFEVPKLSDSFWDKKVSYPVMGKTSPLSMQALALL